MLLCKKTAKNQVTLPKKVVEKFGDFEYFQVDARENRIILIPVKSVPFKENSPAKIRKKTAGLDLSEKDIEDAIAWARGKEE